MKKAELIFLPAPFMGHITQALELAKLMVNRNHLLRCRIVIMKLAIDPAGAALIDYFAAAAEAECHGITFLHLPTLHPTEDWKFPSPGFFLSLLLQHQKPHLRDLLFNMSLSESRLAGFVVDKLCTTMMDLAKEFAIPAYVFFTSNAAFLGLMLHCQDLHDEHGQDVAELKGADSDLNLPSFANPFPASAMPFVLVDKRQWNERFLHFARGYKKASGIILNSFLELESHAFNHLLSSSHIPAVYPVGPILNTIQNRLSHHNDQDTEDVSGWLDAQPQSSVVFLCFGSRGSFPEDQVREIAKGLEQSGYRFLWSLRRPPPDRKVDFPEDYAGQALSKVLPEGFFDRTKGRGKVVSGWVQQLAVLSHPAVGGFVSHCGWNSVLESIWCGVPIATWPIYAEQQMNAFQLVRELGLAVEITLEYDQQTWSVGGLAMVSAAEIEQGIRKLLEDGSEIRKKVKEMCEKGKMATTEGGTSYAALGALIENVVTM